jgi:hypothetical protein
MGKPTAIATDSERSVARTGLTIQAEAHGLDMSDEKIQKFLEHLVEVHAQNAALVRVLSNIVHRLPVEKNNG